MTGTLRCRVLGHRWRYVEDEKHGVVAECCRSACTETEIVGRAESKQERAKMMLKHNSGD